MDIKENHEFSTLQNDIVCQCDVNPIIIRSPAISILGQYIRATIAHAAKRTVPFRRYHI